MDLTEIKARMAKSIDAYTHALSRIRTGRAHPSLLEHIQVSYYGADTPLAQVANVAVEDARTLSVTAWDKGMVSAIEKAILTSDLGLNPNTAGTTIRIPLPPLTEERRVQLVRVVREEAEQARVAVRNIRRDANNALKSSLKSKEISEDEERQGQDQIQKLTDDTIVQIDTITKTKESDLMAI